MYTDSDDDDLCVAIDHFGRVYGVGYEMDFRFRVLDDIVPCFAAAEEGDATAAVQRCEFLKDCEIADTVLTKATNWMPANREPRNALESLAYDIFKYHTRNTDLQEDVSGAEWWVQRRPVGAQSLGYHWDKDEGMREKTGVFVTPHLSTVTYLTTGGAPTVVIPARAANDGNVAAQSLESLSISQPAAGKHVAFDGRYLHGVDGRLATRAPDASQSHRVTFLVNVWVGHRPHGVPEFPESMSEKVSSLKVGKLPQPSQEDDDDDFGETAPGAAVLDVGNGDDELAWESFTQGFGWSGDDLQLDMHVPMEWLKSQQPGGTSVVLDNLPAARQATVGANKQESPAKRAKK